MRSKKILLAATILSCLSPILRSQTLLQSWIVQTNNDAVTNSDDIPRQTLVDNTGKVAIIGESNGKIVVAAYDQYGNNLWTNKYNSSYSETVSGFTSDNAGNYYAGYFWGGVVRKISPSGTSNWTVGTAAYHGRALATNKSAGITYAIGTDYSTSTIYVTKIGNAGNVLNTQTYSGHYGLGGTPVKCAIDGTGKLLVIVNMKDSSGNTRPGLVKFDAGGNFAWEYTYTAKTGQLNELYVDTISNATYVTGFVDNGGLAQDVFTMKVGSAGNYQWSDLYNDPAYNGNDIGSCITTDNLGNYYVSVVTFGTYPNIKYSVRKISAAGAPLATNGILSSYYNSFVPYPRINYDPANKGLYISGTIGVSGYDNKMALYKTNTALTPFSMIYSQDGSDGGNDYGVDIDFAPDGDPVFTGNIYATSGGNSYFYVNMDTLGNFNFSNSYNGIINARDEAYDVIADNGNLPVVAGSTQSVFTDFDGMLIKYDASGNVQFQSIFAGPDSMADRLLKVDTTSSGQYYAAGYAGKHNQYPWLGPQNDMWVLKTDANGALLWQSVFSGTQPYGDDQFSDMTVDASNNVYLTGWETNTGTGTDAVLEKINSSGSVLWKKKFTGAGSKRDVFNALAKQGTSSYYAVGSISNATKDVLICKYDGAGNLSWSATYNSTQNGNDSAIAVTTDASNNVYVVCLSDSAKVITLKYSSSGVLAWAKAEPSMTTAGPSIVATQGGRSILVCEKDSGFYDFQTIICYDNTGNTLWTQRYNMSCCDHPAKIQKTSRGTIVIGLDFYQYFGAIELDTLGNEKNNVKIPVGNSNGQDGERAICLDKNGNVYTTGYFVADNATDVFTQKLCYTPAPVTISGSAGICAQSQGNIYSVPAVGSVTSYAWSALGGISVVASTTNSVSVNAAGSSGILLLQESNACGTSTPDSIHLGILSLPVVSAGADQTVCPNTSVTLTGSGAQTYTWNNSVTNGVPFTATTTQLYVVAGSDANGCSNRDTAIVYVKTPAAVNLCLVTVDTFSTHNILTWEKTGLSNDIASFNIYREDITNNYTLIGSVPFDSLSEYHDHDMVYADPNVTTKRYKISAVDTCGNEGVKSAFHNTIFMSNNNGTFSWNTYTIQGQPNPVNSYELYRDNLANGVWTLVGSTAGTQNILSDPQYATYQTTADWRVETVWNISCTPTLRQANGTMSTIVKSKSNISNNRTMSVKTIGEVEFSAFPNPTTGNVTIQLNNGAKANVKVMSMLGEEIYRGVIEGSATIDLSKCESGAYLVQVTNEKNTVVKRIVKN